MQKVKDFIKLIRIKHYIKNILIFIPLFFSRQIFNVDRLLLTICGFISFSLIASAIYIFNDIKDIENDRKHLIKKERPIASGRILKREAIVFMAVLIVFGLAIYIVPAILLRKIDFQPILLEILYIIINIGYSLGLKKIPIIDIIILTSGFIIRLLYGASLTQIEISNWLYLTVMAGAFYLGLGKRRNEMIKQGESSREVLKKYNKEFLDKFMYVCLILAIVFYSLWCIDINTIERIGNNYMIWTIPILLVIFMKYSLNIEGDTYADPVDIILKDKLLVILVIFFGITITGIIYI